MQVMVDALQLLLAAIAKGGALGPSEPATAYLPTPAKLTAQLATEAQRRQFLQDYLDDVRPRWDEANALGLLARLERVRAEHQVMKGNAAPLKPVPHLPQNDVAYFYEHLALDNTNESGNRANRRGRDLLRGTTTVAAETTTAANAVRAVMHLRRLDDVLLRVLAAHDAAQQTGTPLADVLALYRVEGNLDAPPSSDSLNLGIPSGTFDAVTSLNPAPNIQHLALLLDPGVDIAGVLNLSAATDDEIRALGVLFWSVHIAGLDVVGAIAKPWRANFARWSADNWVAAGQSAGSATADRQAAEARWDALVANMDLSLLASGSSTALSIAPRSPRVLVSGILAEASMQLRAWGTTKHLLNSPASQALTPGMSYLAYHAGEENIRAILARSLVAVTALTGIRYSDLRARIFSDIVTASRVGNLRPTEKLPDATARTMLLDAWVWVQPWLQVNDHLALVSDFIETVDGNAWRSWREHRGNLSRYRVLRAYYQHVFP
jgi:hypothetical protein